MSWKLPRPIKPLEKPLPEHTGLLWNIGRVLTPVAPFAAVALFALPTAFVAWFLLNTHPIARSAGIMGRDNVSQPDGLTGTEWFVGVLVVLQILGVIWPRGFLAVIISFWSLAIILLMQ